VTYTRKAVDVRNHADAVRDPGYDSPRRTRYYSRPHHEDRDVHLLRLSLDLQLDAMLLTLGAAAAEEVTTGTLVNRGGPSTPHIPWARWLAEDLELTRALTATAISVDAALPPTLGATPARKEPQSVADDLLARYESICSLLTDLIRDVPADVQSAWQPSISHALSRCRARVDELCREREVARMNASPPPREEHRYLPGEMLG